ncbi:MULTISPECIES: NmrA family NAD(P)-binding protein [unclassified Streptomyces]|uniref:SDR family oxidoreductase n=1 Tax=unclassified Streptomyces TaxID=2593676 RepID=UPI000D388B5A|nr:MULTISPECIES: NmrA family NAD(P)-binding protein [unclassified Streptomyces]PTM90097.1 uncharacterized protein YbjT (DUF2867 family) [Streptomyces sp. VMFN-G11Ma]
MERSRTYAVTAATGHVGGYAVRELLRLGHSVRAMGRDRARMKELEAAGAEILVGDLADRDHLERAFTGVDGALLIVPPQPAAEDFVQYQIDMARGYTAAARAAGLRNAVVVSAMGANDKRAGALIEGHANIEAEINTVPGLNVVHLHPTSFFEILYYFLQPLREENVLRTSLGSDAQLQLVAGRDVGATGARLLADLSFRGISNFPVLANRTISLREVCELISEQSGRTFTVEQISAEADIADLVSAGTGHSFAAKLVDTWAMATARGEMPQEKPAPASVAEYRIEDFIRDELVPAIEADVPISEYSTATRPRTAF